MLESALREAASGEDIAKRIASPGLIIPVSLSQCGQGLSCKFKSYNRPGRQFYCYPSLPH
jgi:hypothetical protein